eukprot:366290-Chlamydomonas_euryale.AAC.6
MMIAPASGQRRRLRHSHQLQRQVPLHSGVVGAGLLDRVSDGCCALRGRAHAYKVGSGELGGRWTSSFRRLPMRRGLPHGGIDGARCAAAVRTGLAGAARLAFFRFAAPIARSP